MPPAISTSSAHAMSRAFSTSCGSTPRSKRREASELSLSRRAVRATVSGSQVAASKWTLTVSSEISEVVPPMTPASD